MTFIHEVDRAKHIVFYSMLLAGISIYCNSNGKAITNPGFYHLLHERSLHCAVGQVTVHQDEHVILGLPEVGSDHARTHLTG